MIAGDLAHKGETEPRAGPDDVSAPIERLEYALALLRRNAGSGVFDRETHDVDARALRVELEKVLDADAPGWRMRAGE